MEKATTTPQTAAVYNATGHPLGMLKTRHYDHHRELQHHPDLHLPDLLYVEDPQPKFRRQCTLMLSSQQVNNVKPLHTGLRIVPSATETGLLFVGDFRKNRRDLTERPRTTIAYQLPPVGLHHGHMVVAIFAREYRPENRFANANFARLVYREYIKPRLHTL